MTVGIEKPVVVGVLVVVAGDLLLCRALGVCLYVGMKETSSVTHILQCRAGAVSNLEWAVLANLRSSQIGLEEGAHLGISGAAVLEDQEVQVEGEQVNREGNQNKSEDSESHMREEFNLVKLALPFPILQTFLTFGILRSPNLFQRSSIV